MGPRQIVNDNVYGNGWELGEYKEAMGNLLFQAEQTHEKLVVNGQALDAADAKEEIARLQSCLKFAVTCERFPDTPVVWNS